MTARTPASGGAPIIDADGIGRTFTRSEGPLFRRRRRTVTAVRDVSFQVTAGEIVGYLGPNGAGKSTTMKMLTGILSPSAGRLRVTGLEPSRQRTRLAARMGVVFGQRTTLWWDLPLRDSLALTRHMYRVPARDHARRLAELTELLELGPFLATPVRQLSLGQRMRGDLTAALLHDPALLVLDEPTIGLDVVSKSTIREFLLRLNAERGTTILLTTHDLGDVERLCRRVIVIDHGSLAFDGDLAALRDGAPSPRTLVVDLAAPSEPIEVPGARTVRVRGTRQWLELDGNPAAVIADVSHHYAIADLTLNEPDIEDVVARLYRREGAARELSAG
ncbi:ABC transporter ATP-binding protein [Marinitenerispora sediminis]|uniref:Methionine ABC transporter ATP-binding protein n=1 Tax=Marinitenerispora sediminis TaxID=1931232 RepID=A0A368T597_9ACTN|nr:ATP-binding cassette domain-containing protein [Marinitenerispora sediminis]RCV57444.1 methionine ABC transporter ATP-binding protein [Marinitenerispora sediminis]RCV58803.1 methionine ABC transporter ATP-binding protein [Marinitenerispora sediminis]RCV61286.1 methionine ABC transporter ATP-binding protein [Marinitenerispora sediminis]